MNAISEFSDVLTLYPGFYSVVTSIGRIIYFFQAFQKIWSIKLRKIGVRLARISVGDDVVVVTKNELIFHVRKQEQYARDQVWNMMEKVIYSWWLSFLYPFLMILLRCHVNLTARKTKNAGKIWQLSYALLCNLQRKLH